MEKLNFFAIILFLSLFVVILPGCNDKEIVYAYIMVTPTPGQSSYTPLPTPTVHPDLIFKINELAEYEKTKIIVKSIRYDTTYPGGFSSGAGYKFAIVNFDVYTEEEPTSADFHAGSFMSECRLTNSYIRSGGFSNNDVIKPMEWKNIEFVFSILNEYEVESVFLKCPNTSIDYNVEVLLK